jgi:hypothetical protein
VLATSAPQNAGNLSVRQDRQRRGRLRQSLRYEHFCLGAQGFAQRLARDEYETQFQILFEQIVAYAAGTPTNVVNLLALQKRHAQAHQVVESIPVHHVLAAIDNVEIDFRVRFLQQFGAFTGVRAVFAAK